MIYHQKKTLVTLFLYALPVFVLGQSKDVKALRKIPDSAEIKSLDDVVISASRIRESILKSPVSIENVDAKFFNNSASPTFFDALENVKGIQMLTSSIGFKIINTRGFANTTNVRFTQLVDGMDNQAPHIGSPIGNSLGPSDLDIERVEIIPGSSSALYGLNAVNGLANFITKDPFTSTGITIQQKTGVNRLGNDEYRPKPYSETSVRLARKLSERLAVKLNVSYMKGSDWVADNRTDLNSGGNAGIGLAGGLSNPAYDPVNGYGNESSNRRTITLMGRRYVIARTGYAEEEVTDYNVENVKADLGIHYKLNPATTLSYTYRFANLNNVYQRANRFALKDYMLQQHTTEIKNQIFQFRALLTSEDTGNSYNLRSAAENIDRRFKTDDRWFTDFANGFNSAANTPGVAVTEALNQARRVADAGRLTPGTPAFQNTLLELSEINNWDMGAALRVKDYLLRGEAQMDISKSLGSGFRSETGLDILAGIDYQSYIIRPDGNYFINPLAGKDGRTFSYDKIGGFLQIGKNFGDILKLAATIRADKNDHFETKYNPRFTAVITPDDHQSIRASYQQGSRFPSIFEAYSNVNSGGVRRVGGLKVMSSGVFENAYLRSSIDRFQAAVINDFNNRGLTTAQAIEAQKVLLVKNSYDYLQPENIKSLEFGYKGLFFSRKLKADADFYYNKYNNFIAQIEMNVPLTNNVDSIPYYLNNRAQQNRYRIYTNSQSVVYNFGGSFGLSYLFMGKYSIGGNVTYSRLIRTENNDGFEDGFNTPRWITNVSFGAENIFKRLSFNALVKHQSSFYWQSFLVNGNVRAYTNVDVQTSYDLLNQHLNLKLGATNILNKYYYSYLGGPNIGGMYYTTLTYKL